jgi:hypothetical protein
MDLERYDNMVERMGEGWVIGGTVGLGEYVCVLRIICFGCKEVDWSR